MDLNSSGSSLELDEGIGESSDSPLSTPRRRRGGRGRQRSISPIITLRDPQVGDIVWAKVMNHRWWPAILVNKEDCGKLASLGGRRAFYFVYWYGDGRVSPIAMSKLVDFRTGFKKFIKPEGSSSFKSGVYMAITEFRKHQEMDTDNWDTTKAFAWAEQGFPLPEGCNVIRTNGIVSQHVREKLLKLRVKYENNDDSGNENEAADSSMYLKYSSKEADLISSVRDGTISVEDICLSCVAKESDLQQHPLFYGSICEPCMENFMQYSYSVGLDLVAFHCSICMNLGDMMVCSQPHCYRAYCCKCIVMKATLGVIDNIREANPWSCFLCEPFTAEMHGLLRPRTSDWKRNMWQLFHSGTSSKDVLKKMPLNILCLDGSCGTAIEVLTLLSTLGIQVDELFLCNFGNEETAKILHVQPKHTTHLKSMRDHEEYEALSRITPIQVVIASSGDQEKESFGSYFFAFYNIVSMLEILNRACIQRSLPLMWVFEAAPPYWQDYNILITRYLHFNPAVWSKSIPCKENSNPVWTNIAPLWPYLKLKEDEGASQQRSVQPGENCTPKPRRGRPSQKSKDTCDLGGSKRKRE